MVGPTLHMSHMCEVVVGKWLAIKPKPLTFQLLGLGETILPQPLGFGEKGKNPLTKPNVFSL